MSRGRRRRGTSSVRASQPWFYRVEDVTELRYCNSMDRNDFDLTSLRSGPRKGDILEGWLEVQRPRISSLVKAKQQWIWLRDNRYLPLVWAVRPLTPAEAEAWEVVLSGALRTGQLGVRVRRGAQWKWGDQDGGAGRLGTTARGDPRQGWIKVVWDEGGKFSYRVGAEGQYDLAVVGGLPSEGDRPPALSAKRGASGGSNGSAALLQRGRAALPVDVGRSAEEVAEELAGKGFTVQQLLEFYIEHERKGLLNRNTTTAQVVSQIIVADTADTMCGYMDGEYMKKYHGPQRATRMVSHAWKSAFSTTVRNIIIDAAQISKYDPDLAKLRDDVSLGEVLTRLLDRFQGSGVLEATYWLCAFAVNQHRAICGDCWECRDKEAWKANRAWHLRQDPCALCERPKANPCPCGLAKWRHSDAEYQMDKFELVVRRMDALVVSLDAELKTVKRIWVVAEIAQGVQDIPVHFRLWEDLSRSLVKKLENGTDLVPPVRECEATSRDDKKMILRKVQSSEGGEEAFNSFVNCMLGLNFARGKALDAVHGAGTLALARIRDLEMDARWARDTTASLTALFGDGQGFKKLRLAKWRLSFRHCSRLVDVSPLVTALTTQTELEELHLDFSGCLKLPNSAAAAVGQNLPQSLVRLKLLLQQAVQVGNAAFAAICEGLPPGLAELQLHLSDTQVDDEGAVQIGRGPPLPALARLQLDLYATGVGRSGAEAVLAALPPQLTELWLRLDNEVVNRSRRKLREAARARLPRANVMICGRDALSPTMCGDASPWKCGDASPHTV